MVYRACMLQKIKNSKQNMSILGSLVGLVINEKRQQQTLFIFLYILFLIIANERLKLFFFCAVISELPSVNINVANFE